MKRTIAILGALVASAALSYGQSGPVTIRVGAFPNITHAQAMAGKANGWFEKGLGPNVKIEWKTFNAGPSAMEAMFAGAIDMAYIGPNPTISGYVRSQGEALRVVAGAASGGASLVVRNDSGINKPEDFHGKRVASPQTVDLPRPRQIEDVTVALAPQRFASEVGMTRTANHG